MQKYYPMTMDRALRLTTRLVWLAIWAPPIAILGLTCSGGVKQAEIPVLGWSAAGMFCILGLTLYLTRAMAPRGLALNDIELTVDRAMKPLGIPLAEITEARSLTDAETKGCLRLFGASGFYAHYGLYWNKKLGRFRLYSRRSKDLVLVRTASRLYVLGPDSPEEFLSDLKKLTPR